MIAIFFILGIIGIAFLLFNSSVVDTSPAEIFVYKYMKIINSESEGTTPREEYQRVSIQNKIIVFSGFHNEKYIISRVSMNNGTRIYECSGSQNEPYIIMIGRGGVMASILYQGAKSGLMFSKDPAPLLFV
ncbi:hypothetical protein [Parabacteroides sp.]|mgnify:CR=1 FL=1|uniref:hypothetical protein n=1 Tax=Parabacteroides sp. TaxID=1869337 RepID=UPI003080F287